MAQTSAVNQFEQTFKLNQGKMNLKTVYNNDFKEIDNNHGQRERPIRREQMESRHRKFTNQKLPMESITQHKLDFKSYNPEILTSVSLNSFSHTDLFKSRLNKSLNPRDEENLSKTVSTEKLVNDSSNSSCRNSRNIVSTINSHAY